MPVLETSGGKLVTIGGRASWLSRPSTPLGALGSMGSGVVTLSGGAPVSFAQLYRTQPWVAANVNKLSRQIARLPLRVYKLGSQSDREEVTSGRLVDLLRNPWERGSSVSIKQALSFPTVLHGNSLVAKMRRSSGAPPTSFLPLDWRFLIPHLDDRGGIIFWETVQTGKPLFLDPADVVHVAWMAPDGDLGVSPLQQLGTTIRLEDAAQRYATSSFDNAARPAGALVYDKDTQVKPEEREELRAQIEQTHGGVENAFKLLLLGGGLDWKPFSQTAKEAQLTDSRKLNREEVAAVYDIPPPLIGILDNATFSNVTEQHKMLFTTILGPWLTLVQEALQAQLIDPEPAFAGHFVEFDLNEQLKGDPEKRIPAITKAIESGLYTINEARRMENLPPVNHPHANVPLIPGNNLVPLGSEGSGDGGDGGGKDDGGAVAAAIGRARDRTLTRAGAGAEDLFDRPRFERELTADLGASEAESVYALASILENGINQAAGEPDRLKQFFSALSA